jgi:hypothetical protein
MTQIATIEENKDFEVLVDPKDFGIETGDDKRVLITDVFAFYENDYNEITSHTEITPDVSEKASSLRKKVGKIRTAISKIHKAKKEYWLNGGRSVDSWKNTNTEIVEQKEKKLLEIETHFQRIEQERIAKMRESRIETLKQYEVDGTLIPTIAIMDESTWESFLMGEKLKFEAKKEQERIVEEQRLAKEKADAEEREKMRIENERLKAEAKAKEELRSKRSNELKPYIIFIRDYNELLSKEESEYQKELSDIKKGAEDHWEHERKEQIKKQAQEEARQNELIKEREAKLKLEAELKAKQDAEAKAKADEEARIENEAKMKDKDKVNSLVTDLTVLKSRYWFSSAKNKKMYTEVQSLIDKIINHIQK